MLIGQDLIGEQVSKTTFFTRVSKNIKYLGISLTKHVKNMYVRKTTKHFWEKLKNEISSKLIYRFKAIPIKIPVGFLCRNWQFYSKMYTQMA